MARRTEPAPDCHFYPRVAVHDAVRDVDGELTGGFLVASEPEFSGRHCHFAGEADALDPLPAPSAADGDTRRKHTFGCSDGNNGTDDSSQLHTSKAGSPAIDAADADAEYARCGAGSRAGAVDVARAALAGPATERATCANTAPRVGRSTVLIGTASSAPPVGGRVNPPFSAERPGVPTVVSHGTTRDETNSGASSENPKVRNLESSARRSGQRREQLQLPGLLTHGPARHAMPMQATARRGEAGQGTGTGGLGGESRRAHPSNSTGQAADRVEDVLVTGQAIDRCRQDGPVASHALCQPNITLLPLDGCERRVTQRMEIIEPIETGPLLPETEQVAQRPRRDPQPAARDEQRGGGLEALALGTLPGDELAELVPGAVGQEDVLVRRLAGRPLEDAQGEPAPDPAVVAQDVSHVERGDLVLSERGPEGQRKNDVIPEPVSVLTGDLEQSGLLERGHRTGRAADSCGVAGHQDPPIDIHALIPIRSKQLADSQRTPANGWSMYYSECQKCGATTRPHQARGLCTLCHNRLERRGLLPAKKQRMWSPYGPSCVRCGSAMKKHCAKGFCVTCYQQDWRKTPRVQKILQMRTKEYNASAAGKQNILRYRTSEKGRATSRRRERAARDRRLGIETQVPHGYEELVLTVFGRRCASCGVPENVSRLELDHHMPLRFGYPLLHNAVPLCKSCNSSKGSLPPEYFYDNHKLQVISGLLQKVRETFEARTSRGDAARDPVVGDLDLRSGRT
jgi:5-methylcytosine-specific restriction endonuclease McrA